MHYFMCVMWLLVPTFVLFSSFIKFLSKISKVNQLCPDQKVAHDKVPLMFLLSGKMPK